MTDNTKMREAVLKILASYKQEMERYGYYGSNPGVSVDDFEEIADEIVAWQAALTEQATELERLRKDAERFQAVVIISQAALCLPSTRTDEANRMLSAYQAAVNAGLGIEPAIDAAIAQGKGE